MRRAFAAMWVNKKSLYDRSIYANEGNYTILLLQIQETFSELTKEQQEQLAKERTKELEQATSQLITWQDMQWHCLDGDYAKFIGYGSKPFFNSLDLNANGQEFFRQNLHSELKEYYSEEQWLNMVPDELIMNYNESNEY